MSVRFCLALATLLTATSGFAADYQEAKVLYDQGEIEKAKREYSAVLGDRSQPAKDRAAAVRGLGRIDWLVDGDPKSASAHLRQALALQADECETRSYFARVLRESGRPAEAARMATDVSSCAQRPDRDELLAERVHADLDRRDFAGSAKGLRQISPLGMLSPRVNALRLEAASLQGHAAAAFRAWKDYYWLDSKDAPPALASEPVRKIFLEGARRGAAPQAECRLLDLLARAGFDEAAARFEKDRKLLQRSDPLCQKVRIYLDFRSELSSYVLAQNRTMARMSVSDKPAMQKIADGLGKFLTSLVQQTAASLGKIEAAPKGEGPVGVVSDAFNLGSTFGFTSGYPSVHLGHVLLNETREIEQYGKSAQLNFRVYDQMIENGFQSWLWDGEMQTGGWGSSGAIVQIRTPYALSTIRWAALATDAATRGKADSDARERSAKDPALLAQSQAAGKKVVFLPGLADRLKLQAVDQILAELHDVPKSELPRRFASREDELTTRHSIWIHEGRHALDGKYLKDRNFSQADLEYRAKLAEILLGEYPRMAFGSINDSLVNSDSSHGIANTRIMTAYADWIAAHSEEVAGYDRSAPALTQLDKLTDVQLRTVAAALADFDTPATASAGSRSGTSRR